MPPLIEVEAIRSLADTQGLRAKFVEAERSALRAVELADAHFGPSSTSSALARASLATIYSGMGRGEEADATFRIAIDDLERTLGADHGARLTTMTNYALLVMNRGEPARADELLAQVVETGERVYGEDHPELGDFLQNYASNLVHLGRLDEARVNFERAAQIFRDKVAEDDFVRALPSLSLSEIHLVQQRPAMAETTSREAIAILELALPPGHWVTAIAHCRLARALVQQDRIEEAEPHFSSATASLLDQAAFPEYRHTCLTAASAFYRSRGDTERVTEIDAALEDPDIAIWDRPAVSTD